MPTKAPKKTALAKAAPTGTSLATIDAELDAQVANIQQMVGSSSSQRLSVGATGDFMVGDQNYGSEVQVIVLDWRSRNNFYIDPYNKDNPTPPDCYAIGSVIEDMAPEGDSPALQSDKCSTCPMNQWGSAPNGKGKACQNRRHIAVLLVDPENEDAHNAPDAPIYLLDLSPTNLKFFDGAVKGIARTMGHPVKAIFTLTATPMGTYSQISWTDPVPNPNYGQHAARRLGTVDILERRPDFAAHEAKQKAAPARRNTPKPAPRRAAGGARR